MKIRGSSKKTKTIVLWFAVVFTFAFGIFVGKSYESFFLIQKQHIVIDSVDKTDLLYAYFLIEEEVAKNGYAVAYVSGNGGVIDDAIMFYDLMHATDIWERTTFIATGQICSASNIVWLSAKNRVITPGSSFLIHKAKWNMKNEDESVKIKDRFIIARNTHNIVLLSTGEKESAEFWTDILVGNKNGTVLNAKEALEMGWATNILIN
jgi:ATP-dependent protease ClpP protease subunit